MGKFLIFYIFTLFVSTPLLAKSSLAAEAELTSLFNQFKETPSLHTALAPLVYFEANVAYSTNKSWTYKEISEILNSGDYNSTCVSDLFEKDTISVTNWFAEVWDNIQFTENTRRTKDYWGAQRDSRENSFLNRAFAAYLNFFSGLHYMLLKVDSEVKLVFPPDEVEESSSKIKEHLEKIDSCKL